MPWQFGKQGFEDKVIRMYKAGLQNSAISRTSIGYEVKELEESLPVVLKILKDEDSSNEGRKELAEKLERMIIKLKRYGYTGKYFRFASQYNEAVGETVLVIN